MTGLSVEKSTDASSESSAPIRVMAIYAHPDDPEFFSGGTLAKWAAEGKELIYVLVTSGNAGSDDRQMTPERLMEIREGEQRAAAAVAGAKEVIFLRQHDGEVVPDLALRRTLTRIIRQYKPDWIVTNDPTAVWTRFNSINHPDHRAVGQAVLDAVYPSARDHLTFVELWRDEGLETHKVTRVYLAGTLQPNAKVDISAHFETKLAAIREHKSQVKDYEAMVQRQRTNFDVEFGEDTPTFTEVFRLLTLR